MTAMTVLPLQGIRVLDLSSVIMGPFATQMLAEYGADVIKIEPPEGDIMRAMGPVREPGMGPVFLNLNRGKRSLCVDLKAPEAADVIRRAVAGADVFLTNMRSRALQKLGLDHARLAAHRPGLIYVQLTGFAERGAHAGKPAYDDLIQGMAAIPDLVAQAGGGAPAYLPLNIADKTMGLFAAQAVLAALLQRQRAPAGSAAAGQYIEVPMFETMANFVLADHLGAASFEPPLGPAGNPRLLSRYRKPYRTSDGWLSTIVYTDRHWEAFLRLVGREDLWRDDARFRTMGSRTQHVDHVYAFVEAQIAARPTSAWLQALAEADIPVAQAMDLEGLVAALRAAPDSNLHTYAGPDGQPCLGLAPAARWSGAQPRAGACAPRLGQHTGQILAELGLG